MILAEALRMALIGLQDARPRPEPEPRRRLRRGAGIEAGSVLRLRDGEQ
jgi:hypothetical protein